MPATALAVGLVVVLLAAAGAVVLGGERAPDPTSVAVLPLRGIGDGADAEAWRLTEELVTALAATPGLTVRAPSSSATQAAAAAGDDVHRRDVAYVVDGAVQRSTRVRATLRLVRTADGVSVWAGSFDGELTDAATLAQTAAHQAAEAIRGRLASPASR